MATDYGQVLGEVCLKRKNEHICAMFEMKLELYQTLEDRGDPDYVENNGPFPCRRKGAWLGFGAYFWDAHIEIGHWWGKQAYGSNYLICKAEGEMDNYCWDLHGNGLHQIEFEQICYEMVKSGMCKKDELLVPRVIKFFQNKGRFLYTSIRACGIGSIGWEEKDFVFRLRFIESLPGYFDVKPAIQVCVLKDTALSLRNYKVVYPEHYLDTFA